jgi:tetratricopeptide (TPR) repeat protein
MKTDVALALVLIVCLGSAIALSRGLDQHRSNSPERFAEEPLYLNGRSAKRMTLAFNGLAADWYWMRSLQYVGRKIVTYQDQHHGEFNLANLPQLDLRLLPSLLDLTTTLDPQFIPAYEYAAVILPEVNPNQAVALLERGIAANPSSWRLYQHLGYIYWQRKDYARAAEVYEAGAQMSGAPVWMPAMAARMKAEGGSRAASREMYQHLRESSSDSAVQQIVDHQLLRLDSLDELDAIRKTLASFKQRNGRCINSWREINSEFRGFQLDASGSPLDPSNAPYRLTNNGCDADFDPNSKVAR